MQMDPAVWGPACWRLVFTSCFRLPRQRCLDLFDALRYVLPCVHCRRSYRMHLQRLPPDVAISSNDPDAPAKFAWAIKDYVNGKLGAGALPFSVLRARHAVFAAPVSRMDVADLLCCMAMQVEHDEQVGAYEVFAGVMADLVRACGETLPAHLPLDAKYRSPPTLWLHAQKVKNAMCAETGQTQLSREGMLARYRSDAAAANPPAAKPPTDAKASARITARRRTTSRRR